MYPATHPISRHWRRPDPRSRETRELALALGLEPDREKGVCLSPMFLDSISIVYRFSSGDLFFVANAYFDMGKWPRARVEKHIFVLSFSSHVVKWPAFQATRG